MNKIISYMNKIDSGIKKTIIFFIIWLLVLTSIAFIANVYYFEKDEQKVLNFKETIVDNWCRWDSGFFYNIAKGGYHRKPQDNDYAFEHEVRTAFFPMYPFLVRHLGRQINDYFLAERIISIISTFLAVIFLYKLVKIDEDENTALRSIIYLLLFPAAFFFIAGYSEALFFLFLVSSFYFARKSNWLLAGILGGFATLTRFVGILIFLPLLYEYFKQINFNIKKTRFDILYLLFILLGLGIYMQYLYKSFADALLFIKIENSWDKKLTLNIPLTFIKNFTFFKENPFTLQYIQHLNEYIVAVVFAISAIFSYFKLRKSYFIFAATYMLLIILMGNFGSFNRLVLLVFPVFILWAKIVKKDFYHQLIIFIFSAFLILFTIFYTIGKWSG